MQQTDTWYRLGNKVEVKDRDVTPTFRLHASYPSGRFFIKSPRRGGGAFEIVNISGQILDLLKKWWTFQYSAGFRGQGILIKRSTIVAGNISVKYINSRSIPSAW